ncbi:PREDICTED: probable disease resistance protein At5g45510 isoform X2 [Camelina sativa]|uniref:Probable disease resistance protein At5g45510 isoform X2 n=1 Tax=Camelina sativa TaxID=90675 RepID=A0ABM0UIN6_CAMSA|nr:PREDICTED: probable disease resistance protein At5g45510 isoform X2 [Camelina sativa]
MAVTFAGLPDGNDPELQHEMNDEKLRNNIVEVLKRDGPQRVLLSGKAGTGKTRLANIVGEHVIKTGLCFLTICLHLNRKFKDEWSLYENIASQLCVYSDFEETELDDNDEDEEDEKELKDSDLKKKIFDEIVKQRKEIDEKIEDERLEEAAKANKDAGNKAAGKKKDKATEAETTLPAEGAKKDTPSSGKPCILLILDDEGNQTSEEVVMNTMGLWKFLVDDILEDVNRLKILVTKGGEEPTKAAVVGDPKSENGSEGKEGAKSESGSEEKDGEKSESESEENDEAKSESESGEQEEAESENGSEEQDGAKSENTITEGLEGAKSENTITEGLEGAKSENTITEGLEGAKSENITEGLERAKSENITEMLEGAKRDSEIVPDEGTQSLEKDNKGEKTDQAAENVQDTKRDGESGQSTKDVSLAATNSYDDLINFHTTDVSDELRNSIHETNLQNFFMVLLTKDYVETFADYISKIVSKSKNSPAAIVVLAKSLKLIILSKKCSSTEDYTVLKKKIDEFLSTDRSNSPDLCSASESAVNPILYLAYVLLKTYDTSKGAILDCFWHSLDFFKQCGCVYYRDLITQWMLEGYFDPVRSVEKAYQEGHSILMDLINRGMLKIQENNVVVPEMAMISLIDPRRGGHFGRSRLGFSRVYGGHKEKGIGKITQIDDMIKTVQAKKGDKVTTILVGGDRLRRENPKTYFENLKELEVLGLFEPTLEPLIPSFKDHLKLLRVLVIRDCDLLDSIEELQTLTKLNTLEVSGASSLKEITPDFFKAFLELQSLHLSGLKITSSPLSISDLTQLHCLIIKDCHLLEDLPNIQELVNLEVVDVSGARGLQTCFDNQKGDKKNKSKNKNFYLLKKLQLLDFSESQIERLPIFQDSAVGKKLHLLTRLLLRNCTKLRRLPSLKPLSGLQILDLSGTTSLVEMLEVCFEDKPELKTLNLSGTNLSELATTIDELSSLNELLLQNCINLDAIPNIQKLKNLEVIDVSGSSKLEKIEGSFEDMFYLREVNLFGTKVETTPELPKESKIHCVKSIILADGRLFEGKDWDEVRNKMSSEISENPSSSDAAVVTSPEILEETREIQPAEPRASDCTEMGDATRKERLLQVPTERALYKKTLTSLVDSESPQEVMEINETNKLDDGALAKAEFVSFVDCTPTRFTSIFNKTKVVKGCWLRMCFDIKDLFSDVTEENLKSLETLSITNLLSLETISCAGSLENLKNLSLDCCPKIKTIFSEMPTSLQVLNIKHCQNLEKVVEGVEVSSHDNLTVKRDKCPNFGVVSA